MDSRSHRRGEHARDVQTHRRYGRRAMRNLLSASLLTVKYAPSPEQRNIIESDLSALIIAGPGRGKTATAIAAADAWLKRNPSGTRVLFTSFSNAAVLRIG